MITSAINARPSLLEKLSSVWRTFDAYLDEVASRRVACGAAIVDSDQRSFEWRRTVDPATLSIGSETHCLLGKVCGGYSSGMWKLRLCWAPRYGFAPTLLITAPRLTRTWIRELRTNPT